MTTKYIALRAISRTYKVVAVLVVVITALLIAKNFVYAINHDFAVEVGGWTYRTYDLGDASADSAMALFVGGLLALGLYGSGELFQLFIDMEENTRVSRAALVQLVKQNSRADGRIGRTEQPSTGPSKFSQVRDEIGPR